MKEPVYIEVMKHKDPPGSVGTMVTIRMYRKGPLFSGVFDKAAMISDWDNQAGRLQLLDSILRMVEEASK